MRISHISTLLGSVALGALGTPAMAQSTGKVDAARAPSAEQDGQRIAQGTTDIIVTAQRREERMQDVPIAISAFSQEQLRKLNVGQPQDLYGKVPSLVVGQQGQSSRDAQSYTIRGQATGFLSSPAVAVYLAEVPVPASVSLNMQGAPGMFIDLENVQVLEGPQGTLFGRNTTGGAVLVVPRKPTNEFEGYVEGSIGSHDLRALEGALNIPIVSDVLMIRAAAAYQDRRGFTKDVVWNKWRDDIHYYTGRVGILFKPTAGIENYLMGYYSKSSNNGAGHILEGWNYNTLQTYGFCSDGVPGPVGVPCDVYRRQAELADELGPRQTRHSTDSYSKIKNWGLINNTSLDLTGNVTLRNIVSYQKLKVDYATDQDGSPLQHYDPFIRHAGLPDFPVPGLSEFGLPLFGSYTNDQPDFKLPADYIKQFTEELQVQGTGLDKHLTYTIGGFYYDAKPAGMWGNTSLTFCPALYVGLCGQASALAGVSNKSKALYAQATMDMGYFEPRLESLRLTFGYRYTWDKVEGFSSQFRPATTPGSSICASDGTVVPTATAPGDCRYDAILKSSAPTWTTGLDYKPIKDLMLYAKVSRGYKAGGLNTYAVRPETQTFQPEKLTSYEVGFKSDWRLGSVPLRLNANYYYSDYQNVQRPGGDFNSVTQTQGAQILSATATIQGFGVEASIKPVPMIEIGGNVSYTHGKYKKFDQVVLAPQGQVACNSTVVGGSIVPVPQGSVADYSCNPFQFVTPWIVNIHGSIDLPVPETMGKMSLFVNYSHVSRQNTTPLNPDTIDGVMVEPGASIKGFGLLNASLTWSDIGRTGVDATLFGTNLANKLYRVSNSGVYQTIGVWSDMFGEPRMYGIKLRYRFGG